MTCVLSLLIQDIYHSKSVIFTFLISIDKVKYIAVTALPHTMSKARVYVTYVSAPFEYFDVAPDF